MSGAAPAQRPSGAKRPTWVAVLLVLVGIAVWWFLPADDTEEPAGLASPSQSSVPQSSPSVSQSSPSQPAPSSRGAVRDEHGFVWIDDEEIPDPGDEVLEAIDDGGPFEYEPHDDSVFGNREGLLPARERGYYREYTVETPGLSHRGARRIVAGRGGELYWTDDHYASFERIRR